MTRGGVAGSGGGKLVIKTVLAGIGATSIVLVAAVSIRAEYAGDKTALPRLGVRYADFDLTTDRGVRLLRRRIGKAVIHVCAEEATEAQNTGRAWDEVACHRDAWAGVEPQLSRAIADARQPQRYEANAPVAGNRTAERDAPPRREDGILGSAIDGQVAEAFGSGRPIWWRDGGWRGVVQVSESRRFGGSYAAPW